MIARLRRFWCELRGHDALLQFEIDRMFLKCVSCGHETPGWSIDESVPPATSCLTRQGAMPQRTRIQRVLPLAPPVPER